MRYSSPQTSCNSGMSRRNQLGLIRTANSLKSPKCCRIPRLLTTWYNEQEFYWSRVPVIGPHGRRSSLGPQAGVKPRVHFSFVRRLRWITRKQGDRNQKRQTGQRGGRRGRQGSTGLASRRSTSPSSRSSGPRRRLSRIQRGLTTT